MVITLLLLISALLAALVVIAYRESLSLQKPPVIAIPAPPHQIAVQHDAALHPQPRLCAECRCNVVRYDHRGVCMNCISEGK